MTVSVLLLAAALSAGNAEFDRTAAEGAARISAARFAAEMVRRGPDADALAKAMLDNPDACASRRAAEGYCRDLFEKSFHIVFLLFAAPRTGYKITVGTFFQTKWNMNIQLKFFFHTHLRLSTKRIPQCGTPSVLILIQF